MRKFDRLVGRKEKAQIKKKDAKGVRTLVELFTTRGILYPSKYVERAARELRKDNSGSRALADLITELLVCRSKNISYALIVAQEVSAVPELIEAVRSVASASETTVASEYSRFTPEIAGVGRVGWTSGTYSEIKKMAVDTLDILSGVKTKEEILRQREEAEKDVEALIETLRHNNDPPTQNRAAFALGKTGDPRAVEPLIEALANEYIAVRLGAIEALGEIGDARAVGPLIQALKDEYCGAQYQAAQALGKLGDARAVGPLIQALKDDDEMFRAWAADALGQIGDKRAVQPLKEVTLKDKDEDVRETAEEALKSITAK